jgi:hypothetical protein
MTRPWNDIYNGVHLYRLSAGAYTYTTSHIGIDADGAPNAYHENDSQALDYHANALYPRGAWQDILVPDPAAPARPYRQPAGPYAGYFVSMTALSDGTKQGIAPGKYVDATAIPYIVFPRHFHEMTGTGGVGDLAMVRNLRTGDVSAAIVADVGPADAALGEVSIKLAANLGGTNPNPKNGHGAPVGPFRYVLFPRSHTTPRWPLSLPDIEQRGASLLAGIGGWAAVDAADPPP